MAIQLDDNRIGITGQLIDPVTNDVSGTLQTVVAKDSDREGLTLALIEMSTPQEQIAYMERLGGLIETQPVVNDDGTIHFLYLVNGTARFGHPAPVSDQSVPE